jgi:hypothetical protein
MDDFSISSLHESKNEWASRLITILTPLIIDGYKSILDEAVKLCRANNEMDKYLMTFQNFISRIPKWNPTIIETERKRICEKSGCNYLNDLVTCVHIIQLKILTAMRVGQKQKKIDIDIPSLDDFIHNIYINVARKVYKNVYLFEINIPPLQMQKNNRELEIIVQECILNTLRESIPVDTILKVYMDETVEEDVVEEVKEQIIEEKPIQQALSSNSNNPVTNQNIQNTQNTTNVGTSADTAGGQRLKFNDVDYTRDSENNEMHIHAPKTIERLEEISELRFNQRKQDDDDDDDDNVKLNISDQSVDLGTMFEDLDEPKLDLLPDLLIDDIEVLE